MMQGSFLSKSSDLFPCSEQFQLSITPFRKASHPPRRAKNGRFHESISPKKSQKRGIFDESFKGSRLWGSGAQRAMELWEGWGLGFRNGECARLSILRSRATAPVLRSRLLRRMERTGAFTSYGVARRTKELSRKCEIRENTKKD
jgi:hypothetical protein